MAGEEAIVAIMDSGGWLISKLIEKAFQEASKFPVIEYIIDFATYIRNHMCIFTATTVTAIVAVLVAIITLREWMTNRARLRHELFDRRYAEYEQITEFIANILKSGNSPLREPVEFLRQTKKAYFVFACDKDVKILLQGIYDKAIDLYTLQVTLDTLNGEARIRNVNAQAEIRKWFQDTMNSMEDRFEKYLKLPIH